LKNIFVGNLSFRTDEAGLRSAFEPFGEVLKVNMVTDRETGRARGFAFVEMANEDEADRAIAGLGGKELEGRALTVNEARAKSDRNSGGGRGGYQPRSENRW
jgi:RNA recognition motif-containing protein